MRIVRWWVAGSVLVALAGCSDGSGSAPALSELAGKIGCAVIADETPSEHAAAEGSCDDYTLTTFSSEDERDAWLRGAEGVGGPYLVGEQWVVSGVEKDALQGLSRTLGGDVRD